MLNQNRPTWNVYDFEPLISQETMNVHVNKLHTGYISKLNQHFKNSHILEVPPSLCLRDLNSYLEFDDTRFYRNMMGGNVAHTLFWKVINPNATLQQNSAHPLAFGRTKFEILNQIVELGSNFFGSGWVWGYVDPKKNFEFGMYCLRDHDTPYMRGHLPIFCVDLWEHAYFIDTLSDRKEWLRRICRFLDFNAIESIYINLAHRGINPIDYWVLAK